MAKIDIELDKVDHITTDAIGQPGQRVFYIHAWQDERTVTVIVEKVQIQSLAIEIEQLLNQILTSHPDLPEASPLYDETMMHIHPPIDPLFRVGEMGIGYDRPRDLAMLVLREVSPENTDPEEINTVRLWCTRSQLLAMCRWGLEVASRGRPICPQCGEPMEPEGHFCPKKNGHKK